jgi:hypothetical protein
MLLLLVARREEVAVGSNGRDISGFLSKLSLQLPVFLIKRQRMFSSQATSHTQRRSSLSVPSPTYLLLVHVPT